MIYDVFMKNTLHTENIRLYAQYTQIAYFVLRIKIKFFRQQIVPNY